MRDADPVAVAVLGAGIAGSALAYHLAERSAGLVLLLDPRTPAAGASGRAAGVVTEQLWNAWDVEVARESHAEYRALTRREAPEAYRQNGFLRWSHRPLGQGALRTAHERLARWNVSTELLTAERLRSLLPEVRFEPEALGLYGANDACVDPTVITGLYVEGARRRGVSLSLGAGPPEVARADGRWTIANPEGRWRAERLVLAAGAWTKRLASGLGHPLPLTPYRTQAALLRPDPPARPLFPTGHDVDEDVYVRPENAGRILAGNGTESVEADPDRFIPGGDARFLEHLARALADRWPAWAESEVPSAWAGVCTSTPDRRPLIGRLPGAEDGYTIVGFNGFGVMRAGGASDRLAELIASNDDPEVGSRALGPVRPDRFAAPFPPFPPRPGFTLEEGDDPRC